MIPLDNKTAIVTGASSGIGLGVTKALLNKGCRVIGIARDFSKTDFEHPLLSTCPQDLTDLQATSTLLQSLLKQQPIDILVHAAGSGLFGSIEQFSVKQIDDYVRSNLTSALVICHHLVPVMRQQVQSRIILIGSESAISAGKKGALYSSTRFGLRGLAQSLREDGSRDGITVSLINPGMVRSPFFDQQTFRPGPEPSNAISINDVVDTVLYILSSNPDIVIDEINLSPRNKSIDFKR